MFQTLDPDVHSMVMETVSRRGGAEMKIFPAVKFTNINISQWLA